MKRFLQRIGRLQSALFLSLLYLVFWLPVGLISGLFADWLRKRRPAATAWLNRSPRLNQPDHLKESY